MQVLKANIKVLADFQKTVTVAEFYEIYGVDGDKYWDIFRENDIFTFLEEISEEAENRFLAYLDNKQKAEYGIVSLSLEEVVGDKLEPLEELLDKSVQSYVFEKMEFDGMKKATISYETRILISVKKKL